MSMLVYIRYTPIYADLVLFVVFWFPFYISSCKLTRIYHQTKPRYSFKISIGTYKEYLILVFLNSVLKKSFLSITYVSIPALHPSVSVFDLFLCNTAFVHHYVDKPDSQSLILI